VRISAIKGDLMYHNVNALAFQQENAYKNRQANY
jgi:hypothetical protein